MTTAELRESISRLAARDRPSREETLPVLDGLWAALEGGSVRAAEREGDDWTVNCWVKQGILLAFRVGSNRGGGSSSTFHFRDRDTLGTWDPIGSDRDVRIVPGGSTVRRGAHLGHGVVMMPPAYVNVGAFVGNGSMIDSHVLVGSCAQVGERVHLSAGVQVGGVLEPIGALPVIVEDRVFVGGGCCIFEGTRVRTGAVLASGVILTRATPVYDLVRRAIVRPSAGEPLVIPERAVVVPGSRPASGDFAREHGLQLHAPVIVKYRDEATDAATVLEEALR